MRRASFIRSSRGTCILTPEGVILKGYVVASEHVGSPPWIFKRRELGTDSSWTTVYRGTHERIDIDMDGLIEYRFRSEPQPTGGYAYKLVLHWPMFVTHYNDDKTNPNCVRRTG
jgi:hypothetical protein